MNRPQVIILHHSATKDGSVKDYDAIKNYHKNTMGWKDIGYHYIIEVVGNAALVIKGRSETMSGAHTKQNGMNSKSIGICIVGNFDKDNVRSDVYAELVQLITDIRNRYGDLPLKKHSDYADKTCPGLNFPFEQLVADTSGKDYENRWATGHIQFCLDNGLMKGYPDGSFKPTKAVTREELAIVLAGGCGYKED